MLKHITTFLKDEEGATAIEYGLIAGLLAVAIVTILGLTGGSLKGIFSTVKSKLDGAAGSASSR